MKNEMISAEGFTENVIGDTSIGELVLPPKVVITIEDKEIATKMLSLLRMGLEKIDCSSENMKKIEALARGYNELKRSIEEAWDGKGEKNGKPAR